MSRQELINLLKNKNPDLNKSEIANLIDLFSKSIVNALEDGKNIEIRDFGKFYLKRLKENHNARNPATNEYIYRPERFKIKFKASKKLKKKINE